MRSTESQRSPAARACCRPSRASLPASSRPALAAAAEPRPRRLPRRADPALAGRLPRDRLRGRADPASGGAAGARLAAPRRRLDAALDRPRAALGDAGPAREPRGLAEEWAAACRASFLEAYTETSLVSANTSELGCSTTPCCGRSRPRKPPTSSPMPSRSCRSGCRSPLPAQSSCSRARSASEPAERGVPGRRPGRAGDSRRAARRLRGPGKPARRRRRRPRAARSLRRDGQLALRGARGVLPPAAPRDRRGSRVRLRRGPDAAGGRPARRRRSRQAGRRPRRSRRRRATEAQVAWWR